ncbi:MAG: holo-ACP synthase [Acutalibacteraceae bacterium]|jgi:holo-[acyl-carrier protein] synthase|nr:holo-ACP synthase [Acutalibacteraceae bacterium]
MDIRVGVDLVEIDRMQHAIETNERFLQRVLGDREREYYEAHGMRAESIAAAFAAKEAFSKAMGTGISGFSLGDVQVIHDELGCPHYEFSGRAASLVAEAGLQFSLSLTHTKTTAAAVAVAFKEDSH